MEPFSALLALRAGNSPVPVNSPHKGQWRGAVMFSLICAWINDWINNRDAGDLRRHRGHYDVNVMLQRNRSDRLPLEIATGIHYGDVIMGMIASQITSPTIVYSTAYSGADQIKHQSSASLAFVRGIHRGPVNSPHRWPVTRRMFPFDDVIMIDPLSLRLLGDVEIVGSGLFVANSTVTRWLLSELVNTLKMIFSVGFCWKRCLYFDSDLTDSYCWRPSGRYFSTGFGYGLVPVKHQILTRTNDNLIQRPMHASPNLDVLNIYRKKTCCSNPTMHHSHIPQCTIL